MNIPANVFPSAMCNVIVTARKFISEATISRKIIGHNCGLLINFVAHGFFQGFGPDIDENSPTNLPTSLNGCKHWSLASSASALGTTVRTAGLSANVGFVHFNRTV